MRPNTTELRSRQEESLTFIRTLDQGRTFIPRLSVTRPLIRVLLSWKVRCLDFDLRVKWVGTDARGVCDSVRSYRFDPELR